MLLTVVRFLGLDQRRRLLRRLPKGGVCAEIGVWRGDFSAKILKYTRPELLHLIDPWEFRGELTDRVRDGSLVKNQGDMDRVYRDVVNRFRSHRVSVHRGPSESVMQEFPDGYFDWVYIDGDHSYEAVLSDLHLGASKVKPGGIIAGDDYSNFPGVRQAVTEFTDRALIIRSQFMIRR